MKICQFCFHVVKATLHWCQEVGCQPCFINLLYCLRTADDGFAVNNMTVLI